MATVVVVGLAAERALLVSAAILSHSGFPLMAHIQLAEQSLEHGISVRLQTWVYSAAERRFKALQQGSCALARLRGVVGTWVRLV